jgi:hypothetical protein
MTPRVPTVLRKGHPDLPREAEAYGQKVAGLVGLPSKWTPEFLAVRAGANEPELRPALSRLLPTLQPASEGLIVRSSSRQETLRQRGALDSRRSGDSVDDVVRAMGDIRQRAEEPVQLGLVVQRFETGAATGHLSNERRVSRDPRGWLCEAELELGEDERFRFRTDSSTASRTSVLCRSFDELAQSLRGIARQLAKRRRRFHLEWVWDGRRVWVVQCDLDETPELPPPGHAWTGPSSTAIDSPLVLFKPAPEVRASFPKANQVRILKESGLPYGDVRVLAGAATVRALAAGRISDRLARDISSLMEAPVVVRTDFAR